jgi:hypothetical protein
MMSMRGKRESETEDRKLSNFGREKKKRKERGRGAGAGASPETL